MSTSRLRPGRPRSALLLALGAAAALVWLALEARPPRAPQPAEPAFEAAEPRPKSPPGTDASPTETSPAAPRADSRAQPPASKESEIRGQVRDERGEPVSAFLLFLRPLREPEKGFDRRTGFVREFRDEEGRYELFGIPSGRWAIRVEVSGSSAAIAVDAVEERIERDIVLPRAAAIAGLVLDPKGAALAGAQVHITPRDAPPLSHRALPPRTLFTGNDGRFSFRGLPAGTLALRAEARGLAPSEALEIELGPGEERRELRLALRPAARVRGLALDGLGKPEAGRAVELTGPLESAAPTRSHATTGEGGRFEIDGLAPGAYHLRRVASRAELSARGSSPEHDLLLARLATGERIELAAGETRELVLGGFAHALALWGFVQGERPAGEELRVELVPPTGARRHARVDEEGRYELLLESSGEHALALLGADGALLERRVELAGPGAQRIDLELGAARVAGRVVDPLGEPLAEVELSLLPVSGGVAGIAASTAGARRRLSGTDGRFEFAQLVAGSYRLLARPSARTLAARELELELGASEAVEGLELRLAAAGALALRVLGPAGPVEGATVELADGRGRASEHRPARASDADGRTRAAGLAAGEWYARALHERWAGAWTGPYAIGAGAELEATLALAPAATLRIEISGAREGALALELRDERGLPLARRALVLQSAPISPLHIELGPLPIGRGELRATDAHGRTRVLSLSIDSLAPAEVALDLER